MRKRGLRALTCLAVSVAMGLPGGASAESSAEETAGIVHALNRLGYGPRPGDVEAVRRMGIDAWVERQLHPLRIDDTLAEARVAALATATLPTAELRKGYEEPEFDYDDPDYN